MIDKRTMWAVKSGMQGREFVGMRGQIPIGYVHASFVAFDTRDEAARYCEASDGGVVKVEVTVREMK